jgi:hypothetical protein
MVSVTAVVLPTDSKRARIASWAVPLGREQPAQQNVSQTGDDKKVGQRKQAMRLIAAHKHWLAHACVGFGFGV